MPIEMDQGKHQRMRMGRAQKWETQPHQLQLQIGMRTLKTLQGTAGVCQKGQPTPTTPVGNPAK